MPNFNARHWPRYDRIFRSRNNQKMWIVANNGAGKYSVLETDARYPFAPLVRLETNDFAAACALAKSSAEQASRATVVRP